MEILARLINRFRSKLTRPGKHMTHLYNNSYQLIVVIDIK